MNKDIFFRYTFLEELFDIAIFDKITTLKTLNCHQHSFCSELLLQLLSDSSEILQIFFQMRKELHVIFNFRFDYQQFCQ